MEDARNQDGLHQLPEALLDRIPMMATAAGETDEEYVNGAIWRRIHHEWTGEPVRGELVETRVSGIQPGDLWFLEGAWVEVAVVVVKHPDDRVRVTYRQDCEEDVTDQFRGFEVAIVKRRSVPEWSPITGWPHYKPIPCYEDDLNRCGCSTCINEPKVPGKRPVIDDPTRNDPPIKTAPVYMSLYTCGKTGGHQWKDDGTCRRCAATVWPRTS